MQKIQLGVRFRRDARGCAVPEVYDIHTNRIVDMVMRVETAAVPEQPSLLKLECVLFAELPEQPAEAPLTRVVDLDGAEGAG